MEFRMKEKIINGKKVKGIINEDLKEIVPFEFENIVEVKGDNYWCYDKYFICEKEDGTCSLYDMNGYCCISHNDGYKNLRVLKYSLGGNGICVSAKKNDEVGILCLDLTKDWDDDHRLSISNVKVEVAYKFGKCDEIRELEDKTVQLIKHTKGEDRIGYWYHKNIGEVVEPKFLSYHYYTIKCKNGVGLYRFGDKYGESRTGSYELSDHIEDDKLTLNAEMVIYSKFKGKKKVMGLKQKVYDPSKSGYHPDFKFKDFIPDIYSNIRYDADKQIFFLEQKINGQVKKGFIGVTFDWHFYIEGWWISGYPNLKIVVNVPCEYDDIVLIDNEHALLEQSGKYGLLKFSFGKSNGDWDFGNRKNVANGQCREIVSCIYDSIKKVRDSFIGQINGEEEIITDYIDDETKQPIVVANNYKKVNQVSNNVFLCDLEGEKKEAVVITSYSEGYGYWCKKNKLNKISPCDNAEILGDNYHYLIKVINDNIIDVYSENKEGNIEKIEENVADITYDAAADSYRCVITKNNGHIKYVWRDGHVEFTTEELGIEPNNLSVTYLGAIQKFKVTNNNSTKIYSGLTENDDNTIYENRLFSSFDTLQIGNYTFVGYTEILEDGLITTLSHVDRWNGMKETEILKGNFQIENIVLGGQRIIFSSIDPKTDHKKYGVVESSKGNICIDCAYNNIQYDSNNQVFICSSDDGDLVLDSDGFVNENQNISNIGDDQQVLKLTL